MEARGHGTQDVQIIDHSTSLMEHILVGLRTAEGVPVHIWKEAEMRDVIQKSAAQRMFQENLLLHRYASPSAECWWTMNQPNHEQQHVGSGGDVQAIYVSRDGLPILDSITQELLV